MAKNTKFWLASPFLLIFIVIALFPILYVLWGGIGSVVGLVDHGMSKDQETRRQLTPHAFLRTGSQEATLYLEMGLIEKPILESVDSLWQGEDLMAAYGNQKWLVLSDQGEAPKFLTAHTYPDFLTLKTQMLLPADARLNPL